jgi:hypothetical protein
VQAVSGTLDDFPVLAAASVGDQNEDFGERPRGA